MANSKIDAALKAREQKKAKAASANSTKSTNASNYSPYYAEKKKAYDDKIQAALNARQARIQSNLPNKIADLGTRLQAELDAYNNSSATFGEGAYEKTVKSQTSRRANIAKLKQEIEAYKPYLEEESASGILDLLDQIKGGYDAYASMSQFENEEEYDKAVRAYTYEQKYKGKGYTELLRLAGQMDPTSEEYKWLRDYAPTAMTKDDYDSEISRVEKNLDFWKKNNTVDGEATARDEQLNQHYIYEDEIADAEAELERLRAGQWRVENKEKFGGLSENADFDAKSAPDLDKYGKWGNYTYHYINDESVRNTASAQGLAGGGARSEERKGYDLMTDEEREMYNYLYHVSGKKAAQEYLDYLEYELTERRTQNVSQASAEFAKKNPGWASIARMPANLMSGVGYLDVVGQNAVKNIKEAVTGEYAGPINYNSAAMTPGTMSSTITRTVAESLTNKYGAIELDENEHPVLSRIFNGKSLGDVYQLGMSMLDSTAVLALSPFIGTAGTVLLGGSAATQGMLDAVANGATDGQALTIGFVNGVAEWGFERIGMENLVNKIIKGDKAGIVKALISQGLAEGGEELGTSLVNNIADHLIMAEKSGYSKLIAQYMEQGLTAEQAATEALKDIAISMGWDFFGGMISGGIMGGGASVIKGGFQTVVENKTAKQVYGPQASEIANRTLELAPDNESVQKMQAKLDKGKTLSGSKLLELVNTHDTAAIASAAEARLQELGETGEVKALSTVLAKQAAGEKLNRAEQRAIAKSKYGERVANELKPENIRAGQYTSEWAETIGTKRINAAEYSRLIAETQVDAVAEENSVVEAPQVKPATVAENGTVQNPVAVAENVKTTETAQTPAKADTIEEASKKYGAQAGAMLHTYHAGQDVAKYDAAYSIAFNMGKEGVNPDYVKKSEGTSYLSETQVQLAYEAGQAAASTEAAVPGKTVSADEVSNTSEGMALIKDTVAKLGVSTEAASELVSRYDSSISAEAYAAGIEEAFQYGQYDTFENMEADKELTKALTAEQRKAAFELGQKAKETKVKSDEAAIKETYEKAKAALNEGKGKKTTTGKVIFEDGIKKKSLTKAQRAVVDESQIISAALGVNVHVYSGMTEYGRCDMETGDIWLNVNANMSGQTLMQTTLSHELVHNAKRKAPEKFQAFADFLVNEYSKKGVSIKELMLAKQQEYAENGIELTLDEAYEEVVAEAASTMLTDSNAVERLAELNKDHPDVVKMIKVFLQDLLKRIQTLFGNLPADSYEAQLVREMEQETQKALQNLFADMLVDAGEHNKTITKAFGNSTTIETNAEGEFLLAKNNGESESPAKFMFNAATWERGGRDTLEAALRREGFSAKDVKAALTIMDAKYELVKQLGQEYTEQGRINQIQVSTDIKDGKSVVSALVTNGDYPVNIDLLMVCKKRQAYQKVINRLCETGMIQKATVDSLAIAEINKILGKYGFETACLGCFVESRRLRVQEWAETICKEWNAEVKKRNPNAKAFGFGEGEANLTQEEVMQLVAELESGEKNDQGNLNLGKGSAVKRMGVLMDKVPSLQKTLTVEDLITPEGLTALRRYDSNLFSMVKSRYGSNSPKYVQDFNPYNSELAKYGKVPSEYKSLREYLYAIGGARMQSFSDFIVENWFDYTQIVADLAARKLPMHTYTKEIALAKLFGMTGIKINMSLIPDIDRSLDKEYAGLTLNENGEYELIWADKDRYKATGGKTYMQSINFADAIALQEDSRYSANVGTIAVGISDNHILKMLDDPRIRMIIPYHSSGMNPIYADMVGSSYYKDYTLTQNTTVSYLIDSKGNRKTLKLTKEQAKKLTAGFEFNQTLQELGDARATAEAYKEWCKDASKHTITIGGENYTAVLTPKFNQFATHENYYKLLEDFNTYDCITEQAAPQGDVTQTYPEAFEDILREEVQAREDYRQIQEPKFDDAMAEIESFLENHSKADSVHYAEQRGIKLGAKDKKLNAAEKAKLADLRAKDKSMYRMPPKAAPAPVFYSQMAKVVEGVKQEKIGAASVVSMLKGKGVKNEEIKWSGIETWLEGRKSVTKQELLEFIQGSMLQIEENYSTNDVDLRFEGKDTYKLYDAAGNVLDTFKYNKFMEAYISEATEEMYSYTYEIEDAVRKKYGSQSMPRWADYKLDGGSNYKEITFSMPDSTYSNHAMRVHWGEDAKGILVHARIQDFETAEGKMLFVEEIQSDWHNEGHKEGYADSRIEKRSKLYSDMREALHDFDDPNHLQRANAIREELSKLEAELGAEGISSKSAQDAPFKGTYHEFVLKRLLRMAAEQGYDSIGWTPAQIQVERWSEEFAEGYRIEYDQDMPKFLNKYGKKWGAKVGKTTLGSGTEIWTMPITDSMKESVVTEGQPMYRMPSKSKYSYDSLVSKPDMKVVTVDSDVPNNRADVVNHAKQNAASVGYTNKDGVPVVYVDDIGTDVIVSKHGLQHGLDRRLGVIGPVTMKAGEILKNSIRVNELTPDNENASGSYVLIGAAKNAKGSMYIVRSVVNSFSNELASVDVLYAINAKKEPAVLNEPAITGKPLRITDSAISIAELLAYVNEYFPDVLPEEVLKHFGHDRRPEGKLGESALYRQGSEASLNTRQLLANALESVAQNDIERDKIKQYKEKIDLVNAQEQKLRELRAEIKDLSFAAGPKDTARIRKLQDEATKTANRINIYDKQLLQLEASKPLQAVVEREKAKAIKRVKQKASEAKAAAKIGRDKTAMRHKIKNVVNELNNYLLKGTKDKHVMIGLQKAVASALDVVNMDTIGAEERIAKLEAELMKAKTPEKIQEISRRIDNVRAQGEKMSEKLANLKAAYAEIKDSSDPLIANSHDDVIEAAIESVAKSVGETPLRNMTLEQLQDVYDLYKMVLTTIRNTNKSFKADKQKSIDTLASNVQAEVEAVGGKKKHLKIFESVSGFLWNNFKPVYAFKAIGSKTLSRLFDNVRAGEDTWAKDVSEARAFYLEQSKKYGYDSWNLEETHDFTSTTGMDFKLTVEQMMSLYAYSKRQQAEDHLKYGGIVFEDSFETKKLFKKFDIKLKTEDATAYNISPETMAAITKTLTAEQKDFVDAMQDYLSTTMGEKGNEVSLELYGVKLFKEKHYFPLKSAPQYMAKAREQAKGEVKIKNSGFTKETNPKAKNPIVLESFMDVWANHVNDMSMYHAFTLPLEDFYRVYNYRTPSVNENMPTEGVNPAIQNAYGKAATNYVEQLLKDLNGGARSDPTAGFINKMMGLFKKGAVFASASVVVQQPSAVARAMALVDSKYFVGRKVDSHKHKALWEEVKQYAPVAMIKEMGYFDTNMGMSTVDFIKAKEYESWDEKMKALVKDSDYRDEVLSKAPALADELAWCMIWEAVKRETIDKHPALKATSEEFLQLAGARFTEVIVNTQVYDSVLSRSANMRSKDTGMKMATAFLAEPTTSINMFADALIQGKRGDKKQAGKIIGAVMASQILNAILVSFVYAARDDDEEKTYWEKYFASVLAEVKDSFNLASYIPFIKDIVSIVQGYDVERSDMAVIADIWKAYEQLGSDKISGWRKVENFAGGIAQIFGLPVRNIMRDARALYQTVELAFSDEHLTAAGLGYAAKEALTRETISNGQQLLESLMKGNEAHAERVRARFDDESAATSAVRSAIKKGFEEGKYDEENVMEMLMEYTDMDEDDAYWKLQEWLSDDGDFSRYGKVYEAMRNGESIKEAKAELTSHGYTEKQVESQLKSQVGTWYREGDITKQQAVSMLGKYADMGTEEVTKTINKWSAVVVTGIAYDDIKQNYLDGKITESRAIEMRMKYGGYDKESAEDTLKEWNFEKKYGFAYSDRAELYADGKVSRDKLITAIMDYKGMKEAEAVAAVDYLEFQIEYPQYEKLSQANFKAYTVGIDYYGGKSPKDAGISMEVYAEYYISEQGIKGIDADGDGETDRNSRKNQILPLIDSLPLTNAQKDILYLQQWSKNGIRNAPWH